MEKKVADHGEFRQRAAANETKIAKIGLLGADRVRI